MEKVRVDKYLWAIRIFKTRSLATAACDAGQVKLNEQSVKPSKAVQVGNVFIIKKGNEKKHIQVISLIEKRFAYSEAIKHYLDISPEEDKPSEKPIVSAFYTGKRQSKIGRPTKRKRRDLDDFFNEE